MKRKPAVPAKVKDVVNIFPADKTAEIFARYAAAGPGARLRIRDDGEKAWVSVLLPGGAVFALNGDPPEINNAHRCPPNTDCDE